MMVNNDNSGNYNSGDYNSGDYNSGDYNSGDYNSGNCNSGHNNSGNYNSGGYNSGYHNSGNYNSGDYNSGNYNSGFFCTETPSPTFFDKPTDLTWEEAYTLIPYTNLEVCCSWIPECQMTEEEKQNNPNYKTLKGYLKSEPKPLTETFPKYWESIDNKERQKWLNLPNFDAEKFKKITGVDVNCDCEHPDLLK